MLERNTLLTHRAALEDKRRKWHIPPRVFAVRNDPCFVGITLPSLQKVSFRV